MAGRDGEGWKCGTGREWMTTSRVKVSVTTVCTGIRVERELIFLAFFPQNVR